MPVTEMKLKLLIDRNGKKVLFAEAEKDFIDFLFYILSLPISTVIRILKAKGDDIGSVKNLYDSLQNLANRYIRSGVNKTAILNHDSSLCFPETLLLLSDGDEDEEEEEAVDYTEDEDYDEDEDEDYNEDEYEEEEEGCKSTNNTRSVYLCKNCNSRASEVRDSKCPNPSCDGKFKMNGLVQIVNSYSGNKRGGFVKGVATYMVMDNLEVKHLSAISSISILNKLNIQNVASLEEKDVVFGVDEALKLLKGSMMTKNVLSSVFLEDAAKEIHVNGGDS